MPIPEKRKVAARFGDGHIRLIEEDVPALKAESIAVEVHASLVSPGSEVGGWRGMAQRRQSPDTSVQPRPFGYSNAGVVIAVSDGVTRFKPGDRVACVGNGFAMHADTAVVPHNLAVHLPDNATYAQGSYAMLMGTALHALRRAALGFGESYAVVGLGLVGQLAAQLHRLAGNPVIGWDTIALRTDIARKCGIDATATVGPEDPVAITRDFTGGYGLDGGLISFGGEAGKAVQDLVRCMKKFPDNHPAGTVVVVGNARFTYQDHEPVGMTNIDIRRASRTGYGYHDDDWEFGASYPPVAMRWTTTTNLELCMRLVADGKLDVDTLTTHVIPLDDVDEGTSAAIEDPDSMLGVVFVRSG
jgi:threonine dehydrogenase-like Zn-dependent dehydrogenase